MATAGRSIAGCGRTSCARIRSIFMQAYTTALGNYGLTKPLKDGAVVPERFTPQYVEVKEIVPAMRRMCRSPSRS